MWPQNYAPLAGSLGLSALAAALPVFALLYLLGIKRLPVWKAALWGLAAATAVALVFYRMPVGLAVSALADGGAYGLFPIGWILFSAVLLYRTILETGKFEIIKDSLGNLTEDSRLQALLIAFAFGSLLEGAAGFGAPVAVAAAMLTGLGFSPFYAAGICLLANTAPVAFGSIGTPIITLNAVTGLPLDRLSAGIGRICAPVSLIVPGYLIAVMGGWKALKGVLPAALVCGLSYGGVQFLASNFIGPQVTAILSSLAAIGSLALLFSLWKPRQIERQSEDRPGQTGPKRHSAREILLAWSPYAILVVMVLAWGVYKAPLDKVTVSFPWPGLHEQVLQTPPVVATPTPYRAIYKFDWLAAAGTSCFLASLISGLLLGLSIPRFCRVIAATAKQLLFSLVTLVAVLALAFVMNYSGATATLGLALAATGALFPFFSSLIGWLGVFLTGSDTSANALFGNLQAVTAGRLGLNPALMAAANSSGGVMGKMISLPSIAVAVAAAGLPPADESRLFRFTLRHSLILASVIGLVTLFLAYVTPQWAP
ncbi:MAG: L-lactate permease [Bryobacteraceae bacterium]